MTPHAIQYLHKGKPAFMLIEAANEEDARRRVASLFMGFTIAPIEGDARAWVRDVTREVVK